MTRRQKSTSICENTKKKSPPSFEFGADWDTYKLSADTQDLLNIKASGNARGEKKATSDAFLTNQYGVGGGHWSIFLLKFDFFPPPP